MCSENRTTVAVKHSLPVSPELVYDAWLNPEIAGQWLFATDTGKMVRVEIDPQVGGTFVFTDRRNGEDIDHIGEYLTLVRPQCLKFKLGVPRFSTEMTIVTVDISPSPSGCEVALTHQGVLLDYAEKTQAGWRMVLGQLEKTIQAVHTGT